MKAVTAACPSQFTSYPQRWDQPNYGLGLFCGECGLLQCIESGVTAILMAAWLSGVQCGSCGRLAPTVEPICNIVMPLQPVIRQCSRGCFKGCFQGCFREKLMTTATHQPEQLRVHGSQGRHIQQHPQGGGHLLWLNKDLKCLCITKPS